MNAHQQLFAALNMIVAALEDLNYSTDDIVKITHLICEGHIDETGQFTAEYKRMARSAQNDMGFVSNIILPIQRN
jgi:hypothetical protein